MEVRVFSFLTMLCVGLYGESTRAEECTNPTVTPSSLAVAWGDPVNVTCSIPNKPTGKYILGFESQLAQPRTTTETNVTLQINRLMNWVPDERHWCVLTVGQYQCNTSIHFTFYRKPDNVTLGSVSDVWVEGNQTELLCEIINVGRGRALGVRWSRADPEPNSNFTQFNETFFPELNNETKIVNKTARLKVTPRREDDGAQYRCDAVLNLSQNGSQVFASEPIPITVRWKPDSVTLRSVSDVWVEGDQTELLCEIINVGRGRALGVRWSRADPEPNSNFTQFNETFFPELNNETKIVNKTARLKVTPRREDDGAQYRCDAVLNLSQHGSRVFASEPIPITVRWKPDNVTLRSVSDVWVEGDQTELLCEIINVGRGRALGVRWSRADPEPNSNFTQFNETFFPELNNETKIVNKTARLKVTPRREDDGAQYRCDAVLNLSQHGSRVFASEPIPITVRSPHNPDFLPWILISVTVLVLVLVFAVCWMHYRRTHMGQYILKQLRSHRHTSSVDHNAEAQRQL